MKTPLNRKHKLIIPKFSSLDSEAEWFDKHQEMIGADISRRLKAGDTVTLTEALGRSSSAENAKLKPVTIRMQPRDLEELRRLAAEKGLPYQTYIKALLRESVRRAKRGR
jgi:predicted DNA binding CopG/RHH family protein